MYRVYWLEYGFYGPSFYQLKAALTYCNANKYTFRIELGRKIVWDSTKGGAQR